MPTCPFCDPPVDQVFMRDEHCYAMWTGERLAGSAMVVPTTHRETPFELSSEEWQATRTLLLRVKARIDEEHGPEGWNLGWNVSPVGGQSIPHAHFHVIPRYADEPFAGRGIRWWLKSEENSRR